jgi:hypothetical protein
MNLVGKEKILGKFRHAVPLGKSPQIFAQMKYLNIADNLLEDKGFLINPLTYILYLNIILYFFIKIK